MQKPLLREQGRFLHLIVYIVENARLCYTLLVTAPRLVRKGGVLVEMLVTFLVAVAAGVACHYIIKWLDGGK